MGIQRAPLVLLVLGVSAAAGACVPFGNSCKDVAAATQDATAFLRANAPAFDTPNLDTLFNGGIVGPSVNLSLTAKMTFPWAADVPEDVFNNYVLPYAHVNEGRSNWRPYLWDMLQPLVTDVSAPLITREQVATLLNKEIWSLLARGGDPIVFKSSQTPLIYDPMSVMVFGYASCTGVSILFADALRAVGVPARLVGTPAWNNNPSNGNHNWVEVWLGEGAAGDMGDAGWYFIEATPAGAGESFANPCDKWFCNAAHFQADPKTPIFASQFAKDAAAPHYPMAWDTHNTDVPGVDRTEYYLNACGTC